METPPEPLTPRRAALDACQKKLTPHRQAVVDAYVSPAVKRAHERLDDTSEPSCEVDASTKRRKTWRRLKRPQYLGVLSRDPDFVRALTAVAEAYPLCRYCLMVPGRICEHSHPIEADPREYPDAREIPARALTACAACNAAERESLRLTCARFGEELRRLHVSDWPSEARAFQATNLADRITIRRQTLAARDAQNAKAPSPVKADRAGRILQFAPRSRD